MFNYKICVVQISKPKESDQNFGDSRKNSGDSGQISGKQYGLMILYLMLINPGVSNEATVRRKLLNFEFWINSELSKSAKI